MERVVTRAEAAPAMNILLVEDAAERRGATARFIALNRPHYVVQCVTSVAEALARLEDCCFDLMLVNRGVDRNQELCAREGSLRVERPPVLLLGDRVTPEERAEAARAGAVDMVARDAAGMEDLFRAADRLYELRGARGRQGLLLRHSYGEGAIGPCSTGGRHTR